MTPSEGMATPGSESAPVEFANTTAGHLHRQLYNIYPHKVVLVATFATHEMMSFVNNWWDHAERASIPNRLVIAMDKDTLEECQKKGMPAVGVSEFFDFEGCKVRPCCVSMCGSTKTVSLRLCVSAIRGSLIVLRMS